MIYPRQLPYPPHPCLLRFLLLILPPHSSSTLPSSLLFTFLIPLLLFLLLLLHSSSSLLTFFTPYLLVPLPPPFPLILSLSPPTIPLQKTFTILPSSRFHLSRFRIEPSVGGRAVKDKSRQDNCDAQNTAGVVLMVEGKMDHRIKQKHVQGWW